MRSMSSIPERPLCSGISRTGPPVSVRIFAIALRASATRVSSDFASSARCSRSFLRDARSAAIGQRRYVVGVEFGRRHPVENHGGRREMDTAQLRVSLDSFGNRKTVGGRDLDDRAIAPVAQHLRNVARLLADYAVAEGRARGGRHFEQAHRLSARGRIDDYYAASWQFGVVLRLRRKPSRASSVRADPARLVRKIGRCGWRRPPSTASGPAPRGEDIPRARRDRRGSSDRDCARLASARTTARRRRSLPAGRARRIP